MEPAAATQGKVSRCAWRGIPVSHWGACRPVRWGGLHKHPQESDMQVNLEMPVSWCTHRIVVQALSHGWCSCGTQKVVLHEERQVASPCCLLQLGPLSWGS